ncbi:hypothetical protein AAC387_Pa09g2151 [Persea americana]
MLCIKAETLGNDVLASPGVILPISLGRTIQKYLQKGGREFRRSNQSLSSIDGSVISSGLDDVKILDGAGRREKSGKTCLHRALLEKDVQNLQKQLQEEIDLHAALANAVVCTSAPLSDSPCKVPDKAQELLNNIAMLEITVLKLEKELVALHFKLSQERNERRLVEYRLRHLLSPSPSPSQSPSPRTYSPTYLRELLHLSTDSGQSQSTTISRPSDANSVKEESNKDSLKRDYWHHPNKLSEEMVRCMRDIYLHLSDSSNLPSKFCSSECIPSPVSPHGHLSCYSVASYSDSSITSLVRSPTVELQPTCGVLATGNAFDPYKVHGKLNWTDIGRYSLAAEVSWMSVGQKQLEYAAEALKGFRVLVEQLAKVNLKRLSCNEKLAFWINLYNALIMHAYLAYGVPKSEIKLFSLMQKAAYTVGGHSFSAADIEYIILKMKPPVHRPQIALALALHKFKVSEEQRKYSIDSPEPLVAFALSCGMYSSPAVRIFMANNVNEELHDCLKDYIRASVGISDKGKLLVPKLLNSYAKGIVEDSLLADWICRYLSPEQVAMVQDCNSQRRQRLLGARSFAVIPFDSRFRYLFLPDHGSAVSSTYV